MADVKAVVMDKTGTITEGNFVLQKTVSVGNTVEDDTSSDLAASCEQVSTHPDCSQHCNRCKRKRHAA